MFGIGTHAFSSGFTFHTNDVTPHSHPYPYGLDSVWHGATNELAFFNSFKMKLAVIVGVVHMAFGICLAIANDFYFGDRVSMFFESIPRLVFLLAIFGRR